MDFFRFSSGVSSYPGKKEAFGFAQKPAASFVSPLLFFCLLLAFTPLSCPSRSVRSHNQEDRAGEAFALSSTIDWSIAGHVSIGKCAGFLADFLVRKLCTF